ncbi:MAG: hypothetical protein ACYCV7_14125, partial [Acidimicrobiales bacterium]
WLALPKTIGLAGILAGSALLAGGGGLGVAALASAQPAGALSAQLPAVGVREQNVNSAGRIRVALPSGGVGVNGSVSVNNFPKTQGVSGTVNVGNLPENSAGQLKVAPTATPTTGQPLQASAGPWDTLTPGQVINVVNATGSGTFTELRVNTNGNHDCTVTVTIDGQTAFSQACSWGATSSSGAAAISGGMNSTGGYVLNYTPPAPLTYSKSLVVSIQNTNPINVQYWGDAWYTTNS